MATDESFDTIVTRVLWPEYAGFLAFDAKTVLIKHYEETLKAEHFGGRRMIIYPPAALSLVDQYFKK